MKGLQLGLLAVVAVAAAAALVTAEGCQLWLEGELERLLNLQHEYLTANVKWVTSVSDPDPAP